MAETTVAAEGKLLGAGLGKLTQKELIYLAKRLCETSVCQCGKEGFRGGFRPGNIYVADGVVTVGPPDKAGEDGWTKDELEYMAPEVFWNGKKTAYADVYSIGLILYVGLNCGNVPFVPMADYKPTPEMRANALRTRMNGEKIELPDSVDAELREIVCRAIEFDEESRFETPLELLNALRAYSGEEPVKEVKCVYAPPPKPTEPKNEEPPKPVKKEPPKPKPEPKNEPEIKQPEAQPGKKAVRLTKYQRQSKKTVTVTLIVIILLLGVAGLYSEALEMSLIDPSSWFASKTPEPTAKPTAEPTVEPTVEPTAKPTVEPTPTPTPEPTAKPEPVYELITEDVSWDEAELKCREMGGHLVSIQNAEDFAAVCSMLLDSDVTYVWIGGYRNSEGKLTWVSGEESDYYAWAPGEPSGTDGYDGASEDYLMLVRQSDGTWKYNDSRMDPFTKYSKYYSGKTAFVCEHG